MAKIIGVDFLNKLRVEPSKTDIKKDKSLVLKGPIDPLKKEIWILRRELSEYFSDMSVYLKDTFWETYADYIRVSKAMKDQVLGEKADNVIGINSGHKIGKGDLATANKQVSEIEEELAIFMSGFNKQFENKYAPSTYAGRLFNMITDLGLNQVDIRTFSNQSDTILNALDSFPKLLNEYYKISGLSPNSRKKKIKEMSIKYSVILSELGDIASKLGLDKYV